MSKHKHTTLVCALIIFTMLLSTAGLMALAGNGVQIVSRQPEYASSLFSTDRVHTIDILADKDDWDTMISNAQAEEYIQASVVIDGETVRGIAIRPKGNSSLSMIRSAESDRYSFKIEFDHYSDSISYHGLDKLVLNNVAQDNTYMKDYVSYQMMNAMGADAPLSSFIWVKINGEDWGLYLAVEGVEEAFTSRVYGNDPVELYKPDSMDIGGGFARERDAGGFPAGLPEGMDAVRIPRDGQAPAFPAGERPAFGNMPDMGAIGRVGQANGPGGRFGGMGGTQTSLVYTDDDPESYSVIFDNAVFNASQADKTRLISSLKHLNEGTDIGEVVDVEKVIRYFVVHNFVLNSDSYTGSLIHNYYLSEIDGQLSMIAWDYNLAFGGMGGFGGAGNRMPGNAAQSEPSGDNAETMVNYPIDSPMLSGTVNDKPMIAWIFSSEKYLARYHEVFAEYMTYFNSGEFTKMFDNAVELTSPYVEKDPTAFCTFEEFIKGSGELREFCLLRAESITGQLNGDIARTSEAQTASGNAGFIDASGVDIQSMGSNSMGFSRARNMQFPMGGRDWMQDPADPSQSAGSTGTEATSGNGSALSQTDGAAPALGSESPADIQSTLPSGNGFPVPGANNEIQGVVNNIPQGVGDSATVDAQDKDEIASSYTYPANLVYLGSSMAVLMAGIVIAKKKRII